MTCRTVLCARTLTLSPTTNALQDPPYSEPMSPIKSASRCRAVAAYFNKEAVIMSSCGFPWLFTNGGGAWLIARPPTHTYIYNIYKFVLTTIFKKKFCSKKFGEAFGVGKKV